MVKGTRTNKFHSFNNVIHFHTLCTQCLLVKIRKEVVTSNSLILFFNLLQRRYFS
jgi:hypothetical protein